MWSWKNQFHQKIRREYSACGHRHPVALVSLVILSSLALAGCDSFDGLLDVNLPGSVEASDLNNPELARTLVVTSQADFECGFAQHVIFSGLWAEEIWNTGGGLATAYWSLRTSNNPFHSAKCVEGGEGPTWTPLQVSRVAAEAALERMDRWKSEGFVIPAEAALRARAHLYAGYSYLLLSETFCEVAFDAGPAQSREAGFRLAEEQFTEAIGTAEAGSANDLLNAARIGRARSRLNLGDAPGVLADAGMVPEGFVYNATYNASPVRRQNHLEVTFAGRGFSVPSFYLDMKVGGVPDPRVRSASSNRRAGDGVTAHFNQLKYANVSSPIPLATWREAQLMIAEIEEGQTAVEIINQLRGTYGLPEFSSSDPSEIRAELREERRRELWLQGTRMADMLRWDEPFRSGVDQRGRAFGAERCAGIPDRERFGNPNID